MRRILAAFAILLVLCVPAYSLTANDVEGYYDNGDDVYLHIGRSGRLLEVSLSSYGENWRGTGHLKGDTLIAEYGGTRATLTFIDSDTIDIETNGAFRRAVGFDAEDIYERHYGK